jgi:uncharacterized protein (DUF2345 family)
MNAVTKSFTDALRHPSARLTQHLRVWIGTEKLDFDVVKFKAKGGMCRDYTVDVTFTSPRLDIDGSQYVGRRAGLQVDELAAVPSVSYVDPVNREAATFNGVVTRIKRVGVSRDEATYTLRLEPRFAALCKRIIKSDTFTDMTFQELLTKALVDGRNIDAYDVEFQIEGLQEKMQQVVMYEESVWNFVTRHCRRLGVFWFYKQGRGKDGKLDTLVFANNPRAYLRSLDVPLLAGSGLNSNWQEAAQEVHAQRTLVPATIELWERNYRTPEDPLRATATVSAEVGDRSVFGQISRSAEGHLTPAQGEAFAQTRRDEQVARQATLAGRTDATAIAAGVVMKLTNAKMASAEYSHPDLVRGTDALFSYAIWRSPLLGAEVVFNDLQGKESARIATVYSQSAINLGYLLTSKKLPRGTGIEITTQDWATMHAPKGLFFSADPYANPDAPHLEMQAAVQQLGVAQAEVASLRQQAQKANAELAQLKAQQDQLENAFTDLKKAVILLSAPEGIGMVTPKTIQMAGGEHLALAAGNNADLNAGDNVTVAAGETVSLFAVNRGIKALAANGAVDIEAQTGSMQLFAEQDMKVTSADGNLHVTAGKSVVISDGAGAYIKMEGGNIEIGCPGTITSRAAGLPKQGPSSLHEQFQSGKQMDDLHVGYTDADGQPIHSEVLNLLKGDGSIQKLTTGADGRASLVQTVFDHFRAQMPQRLEGSSDE